MTVPTSISLREIFLIGIPGAGKTTLAHALHDALGGRYVSSGSVLARMHGTERYSRGAMPDAALINGLIRRELECDSARGPAVVDGFPRTRNQCEALLDTPGVEHDRLVFVSVVVPMPVAVRRLASRRACAGCGRPGAVGSASVCTRCGGTLERRGDDECGQALPRLKAHAELLAVLLDQLAALRPIHAADGRRAPADNVAAILEHAGTLR